MILNPRWKCKRLAESIGFPSFLKDRGGVFKRFLRTGKSIADVVVAEVKQYLFPQVFPNCLSLQRFAKREEEIGKEENEEGVEDRNFEGKVKRPLGEILEVFVKKRKIEQKGCAVQTDMPYALRNKKEKSEERIKVWIQQKEVESTEEKEKETFGTDEESLDVAARKKSALKKVKRKTGHNISKGPEFSIFPATSGKKNSNLIIQSEKNVLFVQGTPKKNAEKKCSEIPLEKPSLFPNLIQTKPFEAPVKLIENPEKLFVSQTNISSNLLNPVQEKVDFPKSSPLFPNIFQSNPLKPENPLPEKGYSSLFPPKELLYPSKELPIASSWLTPSEPVSLPESKMLKPLQPPSDPIKITENKPDSIKLTENKPDSIKITENKPDQISAPLIINPFLNTTAAKIVDIPYKFGEVLPPMPSTPIFKSEFFPPQSNPLRSQNFNDSTDIEMEPLGFPPSFPSSQPFASSSFSTSPQTIKTPSLFGSPSQFHPTTTPPIFSQSSSAIFPEFPNPKTQGFSLGVVSKRPKK